MSKSIKRKAFELVVNGKLSFTTIGAGILITITFVLNSIGVLNQPSIIVWGGIIITGASFGLALDCIQSYFNKFI